MLGISVVVEILQILKVKLGGTLPEPFYYRYWWVAQACNNLMGTVNDLMVIQDLLNSQILIWFCLARVKVARMTI